MIGQLVRMRTIDPMGHEIEFSLGNSFLPNSGWYKEYWWCKRSWKHMVLLTGYNDITKNLLKMTLNPFSHTTILQQTTLNIICQKMENLFNWMDNLWLKVENIVAKREIARFEQFLLLSLCFQKAVCCRGIRKRLYGGKG